MTGARRKRKFPPVSYMALTILVALLVLPGVWPHTLGASTTERVVVDWRSGLAIHGFDPVAYFAERKPVIGRPELEYAYAGAIWRFRNVGNRAAFNGRPDVYAPRFGGYDPLAVARGIATPGHPLLWTIAGDRLYLFHSAESRDAFAAEPDTAIKAAELSWSNLRRELVP